MTNFELVKEIESALDCENADFEAKQMVLFALDVDNTQFIKIKRDSASQEVVEKCFDMVRRRNEGTPLYYILGKAEFYSLPFLVGEGVLIPRDDTEILVDEALKCLEGLKNPRVLDLCSGSGAIAIAIAKNRADAEVVAVELYDEAFKFLNKNIQLNGVLNVKPIQADALNFIEDEFDLIVSNPPYISFCEKPDLQKEVLNEPLTALFANDDGYEFYEKISENYKNGKRFTLLFEIGYTMSDKVCEILYNKGYSNISKIEDFNGIIRVIKAQKE